MATASSYSTCSAGSAGGSSVTAMASTRGRLLAEHGLKYGDSVEKVVSDLNTTDPAAPGMALLYY